MDFGHDVLSVHKDRFILWGTQGHVQDGALLCDVDLLAAEHGVDSRSQTGLVGELKEEPKGLLGDAVLGVIKIQAHSLDRHALATLGIVRKKLPQVQLRSCFEMRCERAPRRVLCRWPPCGWLNVCCHVYAPFVSTLLLQTR